MGSIRKIRDSIQLLPILLPASLAVFGSIAMVLLVANAFYLWALLIGAGVSIVLTLWLLRRLKADSDRPGSKREQRFVDVAVICGVVLWACLNIPLSAQHVLTDRDPATYAVAGAWLTHHHDLLIPKPSDASKLPDMTANSLGFGTSIRNRNDIYAQGSHLLPALLGFIGKLFGLTKMFYGNVFFGAAALLALYGFARLIMRPRWAALSTLALSVSLPFIFFSRDTYTEPLTLMMVFTTLSLLYYAQKYRSRRLWVLTGIAAGAASLLRVDMYLFQAALACYLIVYLVSAPQAERRFRIMQTGLLAIPATLLGILAWVDVTTLSSGYYRDLHSEIMGQLLLLGTIGLLAVPVVTLAWRTKLLPRLSTIVAHKRLAALVAVLLGLFFVALFVRAVGLFIEAVLGRADSMAVQKYSADTTILWLFWYIGPILTIAGIVGFIRGWRGLLRQQFMHLLPFILVLAASSALYLLNPRISADQIWASRRFLPIIFPGFILCGMLVLERIMQTSRPVVAGNRIFGHGGIAVLAVAAALSPALVSLPFWDMHPYAQLSQITDLCGLLPKNALVVWVGQEGNFATEPTEAVCGVQSFSTLASGQQLTNILPKMEAIADKGGSTLFLAARNDQANLLPSVGYVEETAVLKSVQPEETYKKFPLHTISSTESFVLVSPTEQ